MLYIRMLFILYLYYYNIPIVIIAEKLSQFLNITY